MTFLIKDAFLTFESQSSFHLKNSPQNIEKTLSSLKKQKKILNDEIKEKVSYNNPILNNLHLNIMKYAEILKVSQYINLKKKLYLYFRFKIFKWSCSS